MNLAHLPILFRLVVCQSSGITTSTSPCDLIGGCLTLIPFILVGLFVSSCCVFWFIKRWRIIQREQAPQMNVAEQGNRRENGDVLMGGAGGVVDGVADMGQSNFNPIPLIGNS
jgi:hypothetical protein